MVTRRHFLKSAALLAASSYLGKPHWEAMASASPSGSSVHHPETLPLLTRAIPKSGEQIPIVGLGSYRTFDVGIWPWERQPLNEILSLFYQSGGRVVDSSPQYGRSEKVIGDIANNLGLTDKLFMATKVLAEGKENGYRQIRSSFKKMRVRQMDLFQVHNLMDWQTQLDTLSELKTQGKIRYLGVTHWKDDAMETLENIIQTRDLDFLQIHYSLKERQAAKRLLPLARDRGVAVIINRPYAKGALFKTVKNIPLPAFAKDIQCETWAQIFLKYVLSHPAVTCAIPATSKSKHLLDNMHAGTLSLPSAAQRKRIETIVDSL